VRRAHFKPAAHSGVARITPSFEKPKNRLNQERNRLKGGNISAQGTARGLAMERQNRPEGAK